MEELDTVIRSARERIEELLAPTREELAKVEALIAEHEQAIAELKPVRNQLKSAIAHLDPSTPMPGRKRPEKKWPESVPGPATEEAILAWARANRDGQDFTARDLIEAKVRSQTVINKALNLMAERELIRVVRIDDAEGGPGRGRRIYRLVQ